MASDGIRKQLGIQRVGTRPVYAYPRLLRNPWGMVPGYASRGQQEAPDVSTTHGGLRT